jgi:hypothetical protein
MNAHRTETIVQSNGSVTLSNLPFKEGEAVEIIVLEAKAKTKNSSSLRGTVIKYDEPFEPAASLEDWEVLK